MFGAPYQLVTAEDAADDLGFVSGTSDSCEMDLPEWGEP